MKLLFLSAFAIASITGAAQAESGDVVKTDYPQGAIGYDALMAGDNDRAINDILTSNRVSRHDPARMINLGQAYARTGRTVEAAALFTAAIASRDDVDLVLANGSVITSKDAARKALAGLQTRFATR